MRWFLLLPLLLLPVTLRSQEPDPLPLPGTGFLHLDRVLDRAAGEPVLAEIQGETMRVFQAPEMIGHLTLPVAENDSITIAADQIPPVPENAIGLRIQYYYTPESVLQDNKRRAFHFLPRADAGRSPLNIVPLGVASATAEVNFQYVLPVTQQYTTPLLQLPAAARLEFACGLYQPWRVDTDSGARFLVEAGVDDGWKVIADLQISDADVFESTGWQQRTLDLAAVANQPVRLRFSTTPLPDLPEPQFSFPVWGNVVLNSAAPAAERPGPNVLLISLDTLRADRLGAYGYARNTSPNLDRFAAQSVLFEQAIVSAPWTTPSHASVFTGYHPRVHQAGVVAAGYHLGREWTTLAEHLQHAGYLTAAFTEGVALRGNMGFAQGFDRYSDGPDPVRHYHGKSPRTFGAAGDWIEAHRNQPFFAFVHTYEIHAPYGAPEPWGRLYAEPDYTFSSRLELGEAENDRDRTHISNLYDAGIAYTDVQFGRFLQRMRDLGLFEKTIVILFSDHGEEFWEHGAHGHTTHLYDEVLHVPLIIHLPDGLSPARVPEQVGIIDIFATVMDLLNLPAPEDDDSVSLVPLLRQEPGYSREAVHAEFVYDGSGETGLPTGQRIQIREALRTETSKYLRYSEAGAPAENMALEEHLYDLDKDPGEQQDLTGSAADDTARLREALEIFRREKEAVRARHEGDSTAGSGMTQEDVDALRGLGYF